MSEINKDLILREKLALQRTKLANQTTFLAFLRTSMYFMIAGLSIHNVFQLHDKDVLEIFMYAISFFMLVIGIINYFVHKNRIIKCELNIGNFQSEYYKGKSKN